MDKIRIIIIRIIGSNRLCGFNLGGYHQNPSGNRVVSEETCDLTDGFGLSLSTHWIIEEIIIRQADSIL